MQNQAPGGARRSRDPHRIEAGDGADRLYGGDGRDTLHGGLDALGDVFVFAAASHSLVGSYRDVIHNFTLGVDDIDLRPMDAKSATIGVNDAFLWSGTTTAAHSVWWVANTQGAILRGDVNGNTTADFEILLSGVASLGVGDVLL